MTTAPLAQEAVDGGVLVINSGSSSIKFALFDKQLARLLSGMAEEIGGDARLIVDGAAEMRPLPDHNAALAAIFTALQTRGVAPSMLKAAAHRVVHGGEKLTETVLATPEVQAQIAACAPLAPLHNPPNLAGIEAVAGVAPDLPQVACFDTAFHAAIPEVAWRYALPSTPETEGLRRYGFHGISYQGLVRQLPDLSGAPLPKRLLALHLGNGASLCAILDGRSVATSMGYSPLDGLTMGTRSGVIGGGAVLALAGRVGLERAGRILNHESGLLGLGGASDMRALSASDTPEARFAIHHFCYWATRHAGSVIAAMGGLDAIAFTGGIGEHSAQVRAEIVKGLSFLGAALDPEANTAHRQHVHSDGATVGVWIIPAREEETIAAEALRLLDG